MPPATGREAKKPGRGPQAPGRAATTREALRQPSPAQLPSLQQPWQEPFSQQQHPQSSQVHTPFTQQPQQSQSGQGVFAPPDSGARANAAQSKIADMIHASMEKMWIKQT